MKVIIKILIWFGHALLCVVGYSARHHRHGCCFRSGDGAPWVRRLAAWQGADP